MKEGARRERTREVAVWKGPSSLLLTLKMEEWGHETKNVGGLSKLEKEGDKFSASATRRTQIY